MQNLKLILNVIPTYLFYLLPIFLITGPLFSDLTIIIISLLFLIQLSIKKNFKIITNKFFIIFISFCVLITINSLFSDDIRLSTLSSSFYFRFGLFALAVYYLLEKDYSILFVLKNVFLFIIIILFFDTLVQFFYGKNILGFENNNTSNFRITSFFGNDEVLGSYVARFFPFIMSLIFFHKYKKKKEINKFFLSPFIIIIFVTVFLSGERTAFFLLLISSFLIFLSCSDIKKHFVISFFVSVIIIFLISSFNPSVKKRMFDTVITQLNLLNPSERVVIFSKTYEGHYKIALNMFKEKPILGHGVKIFRVYCAKPENFVSDVACTTHPHNIYMQFLSETGIIGFLYLISFFVFITYFVIRNIFSRILKNNKLLTDHEACLLIFYFVTLFPFAPSGNFFNNWLSIIYYFPAGFLIYLNKNTLIKNEL